MRKSSYIAKFRKNVGSELLLVPSVAAIIHDNQNRLLLQRKADPEGWSLPAGAIEIGETPEEALYREVFEETGLIGEEAVLLGAFSGKNFRYQYPNSDKVEYTVLVYRCKIRNENKEPLDSETLELSYFDEATCPELVLPYPKHLLFKRKDN